MTTEESPFPSLPSGLVTIGVIHTPFAQPAGTPIQPRYAQDARGKVIIKLEYQAGLADLEGFERIWLIYWMDRASAPRLTVKPFMDTQEHGVFATRSPCRPNPIGLSCVRLIEIKGCELLIAEVDIVDQTPLLDIKPYVPEFDVYDVQRCGWFDRRGVNLTKADDRFSRQVSDQKEDKR